MSPWALRLTPTHWGSLIILLFFLALIFLEPLYLNRSRSFLPSPSSARAPLEFSLDERFAVLYSGNSSFLAGKKEASLKELASRNLLINFWATWCDPCVEEIPSLNLLAQQLRQASDKELPLLVTISVDEKADAVRKLEKTLSSRFEFIVLHDPDGNWAKSLGITKFPETFLISTEGKLIFKWLGPQDWHSLDTLQVLSRS